MYVTGGGTVTVNVYAAIKQNTSGTKFKIELKDTAGLSVIDAVNLTSVNAKIAADVSSSSFPMRTGLITIIKKAIIKQAKVSIKNTTGSDIDSVIIGEAFKIEMSLHCETGGAGAIIIPADTDLTFKIGNNTETGIIAEFSVSSISPSGNIAISSGETKTITYTVVQNSGTSGNGDTLTINNLLIPDTSPYCYDANKTNSPYNTIKVQEISGSYDTIFLYSSYASVSAISVITNSVSANESNVLILKLTITDNGAADILQSVTVENVNSKTDTEIKRVFIAFDSNSNNQFDSGTDVLFGTAGTFSASTHRITFYDSYTFTGNGDTELFFILYDLKDTPVTDGDTLDCKLVSGGLSFQSQDTIPSIEKNSSGYGIIDIIADRIFISPDTSSTAVTTNLQFGVKAADQFGNIDLSSGMDIILKLTGSGYFVSTNLSNQSPAVLTNQNSVQGNLSNGQASVSISDNTGETIYLYSQSVLINDTSAAGFNNNANASVYDISSKYAYVSPGDTNIVVIRFKVVNPGNPSDSITQIVMNSENSTDTGISNIKLWIDADTNGSITSADTFLQTKNFSGGTLTFDSKIQLINGAIELIVTYNIDTYPVTDNQTIGLNIPVNGITLSIGGNITTIELDSISNDVNNDKISVNAADSGYINFTPSTGSVGVNNLATKYLSVTDRYGNIDRDYTSENVSFTDNAGNAMFLSTSMNVISGAGSNNLIAKFSSGSETILINSASAGAITLYASVSPYPPVDGQCQQTWLANAAYISILSPANGSGTSVQIVSISGTTSGVVSGDSVIIYKNGVFQCTTSVTGGLTWSGTANISGYNDSVTAKVTNQYGYSGYDTICISLINAPESATLFSPLNGSDTYSKYPVFVWNIPNDSNNDSLFFKIYISSDSLFNNIFDSGFSYMDTRQFSWFHNNNWESFPAAGVNAGVDSAAYISSSAITGDSYYWRVVTFDKYLWSETSVTRNFNPIPRLTFSSRIDTITLNSANYNETGIIPGTKISATFTISNTGSDTADNVLMNFPTPSNTVYSETMAIAPGCIIEWATIDSPDQSYNSANYTNVQPVPASNIKWIRFKKNALPVDAVVVNIVRFIIK